MVDFNMRDVANKTRSFSGNKISVLAALQIADEYYRLKNDYDELLNLIKSKQVNASKLLPKSENNDIVKTLKENDKRVFGGCYV